MKKAFLALLGVFLLFACGTAPKGNAVVYTGGALKKGEGTIHICRTSSLIGAMGGIEIFINNEISNGSVVEIVKNSGNQSVVFRLGNGSRFGVNTKLNSGGDVYVLQTSSVNSLKILPIGSFGELGWQAIEVDQNVFNGNCADYSKVRIRM